MHIASENNLNVVCVHMCLLHMCETQRTASGFTHELAGPQASRSLLPLSPILHWNHRCSLLFLLLCGFGGSELKSSCFCLLCPLGRLPSSALSELYVQTEATERSDLSKWHLYFRKASDMCWFSNCLARNCRHLQSHGLQLEPLSCLWVSVWTLAVSLLHRGYGALLLRV